MVNYSKFNSNINLLIDYFELLSIENHENAYQIYTIYYDHVIVNFEFSIYVEIYIQVMVIFWFLKEPKHLLVHNDC